jgi:hypothetical protein
MRIVASVSIGQPASQVLAYMADYSNDSKLVRRRDPDAPITAGTGPGP